MSRSSTISVRPGRTVLASLLGALVGAPLVGYSVGQLVAGQTAGGSSGLVALGAALLAAAVGGFVGAGIALAVAFRAEPVRARVATIATTLLLGPVFLVAFAAAAEQVSRELVEPPVWWILPAAPAAALVGRWIAVRVCRQDGQGQDDQQRRVSGG